MKVIIRSFSIYLAVLVFLAGCQSYGRGPESPWDPPIDNSKQTTQNSQKSPPPNDQE